MPSPDAQQTAPWVIEIHFDSTIEQREKVFDRLLEVMSCEYPELDAFGFSTKWEK